MGLEHIVGYTGDGNIEVRDGKGKVISQFNLRRFPQTFFHLAKSGRIIASNRQGVICTDYSGNIVWEENEQTGDENRITINDSGVWVAATVYAHRKEVEEVKFDGSWLSHLDFHGRRINFKDISKDSFILNNPVMNDKYLVLLCANRGRKFHVLGPDGNPIFELKDDGASDYNIALVGDLLVYESNNGNWDSGDKWRLKAYDLAQRKFRLDKHVGFKTNGAYRTNQIGCSHVGNSLFFRPEQRIRRLNLGDLSLEDYNLNAKIIGSTRDRLFLDFPRNDAQRYGDIRAYDETMTAQWEKDIPGECPEGQCWSFFIDGQGILVEKAGRLLMLDLDGKLKWERELRNLLTETAEQKYY